MSDLPRLRAAMRAHHFAKDEAVLGHLIATHGPTDVQRARIQRRAADLVDRVRSNGQLGMTEAFLAQYGLSTDEGVAVMTLAEALLRVPDAETRDLLIADKTSGRDWMEHAGKSDSTLVNASTLALSVTGHVLSPAKSDGVGDVVRRATRRLGAPVIRTAVARVMRELGHQFVLGETIEAARTKARANEAEGYTYSYDMLGEAALTEADARAYLAAYSEAIEHIGQTAQGMTIAERPGISVKLSALHPRYETLQKPRVMAELVPRLSALCARAARHNIGLNIDAEEADRLDLSLDVIEATLADPGLRGWDGFGVVVQAYGKRAGWVIDWLHGLAESLDRRIMVRLVKGAYWDTEIKQAQVEGLVGYPVFGTKPATDMSYICCAAKLLGLRDRLYPQFATHNAHSLASIQELAGNTGGFEVQRLHGMGEALHDAYREATGTPCRIYAPVGAHRELLAYLVRRLLENGANSSFVNQIAQKEIATADIVADPFDASRDVTLPLPRDLYGPSRPNSAGISVQTEAHLATLEAQRAPFLTQNWTAGPLVAAPLDGGPVEDILNPANPADRVGQVTLCSPKDVDSAIAAARPWAADVTKRAEVLTRASDLYEEALPTFAALLAREAGKTLADVISEVREAVDFLRYYAVEAQDHTSQSPKGRIVAISPWNFPLAIFTGQIAAGLATGNAVLAKPAEATPLSAHFAVTLLHRAGVPASALQLLPGHGADVGAQLTRDPRIDAVAFTGSTATAQGINRAMAQHLSPGASLLAETGGLNAMVVDSTALPEQAVHDIVASAFQSAGQRCSALRVLYVQEEVADTVQTMLMGAMDALVVGDPVERATDVGPVIDARAKAGIEAHVHRHRDRILKQIPAPDTGHFVPPTLIALDGIHELGREVFGPVLHICRYKARDLPEVIDAINQTGYGLTFGLHSRIESRAEAISGAVHAGNIYINRNQIGAVVGSQPFGGEGLSGTGPKAGGPLYLTQFLRGEDFADTGEALAAPTPADLQTQIDGLAAQPFDVTRTTSLPGPTGEANILSTAGRGVVLCCGPTKAAQEAQRKAVEASGARALVTRVAPRDVENLKGFAGLCYWRADDAQRAYRQALAAKDGPLLPLLTTAYATRNFVRERHVCIDTTAAGGNAALLAGG